MNYTDAMAFLNSFIDYEKITGSYYNEKREELASIRALLKHIGNPEKDLDFVHIAGTKGKGSTAVMTASIFAASGLKTGLFTSPHLISFNERVQINRRMISDEALAAQVTAIKDAAVAVRDDPQTGELSFFEVYTVLAFRYFLEENCDIVVLETGLGGRLDATNVVLPRACAITLIGRDHEMILGNTIEKIAGEKAGIIKKQVPLVIAPQIHPEAEKILSGAAENRGAPYCLLKEDADTDAARHTIGFKALPTEVDRMVFSMKGLYGSYNCLETPLMGRHQIANAATAVILAELGSAGPGHLQEGQVKNGLSQAKLDGRFQVISRDPYVVVDGAHNPESGVALKQAIEEYICYEQLIIVFGGMGDHNLRTVAESLFPLASRVILTRSTNPRAAQPEYLLDQLGDLCQQCVTSPTVPDAIELAKKMANPRDAILCTGSLYIAGEVIKCYS